MDIPILLPAQKNNPTNYQYIYMYMYTYMCVFILVVVFYSSFFGGDTLIQSITFF